jgi:primosomal protein N' (replication factor Y)
MIVKVIVPIAKNIEYIYDTNIDLSIGDIVKVPFINREVFALIIEINSLNEKNLKLKTITKKTDYKLKQELVTLIKWVSNYYLVPAGMIFKTIINTMDASKKNESFSQKIDKFNLNTLSMEQDNVKKIIEKEKGFNVFLLEGATGSGKTEIYFNLIKDIIKKS